MATSTRPKAVVTASRPVQSKTGLWEVSRATTAQLILFSVLVLVIVALVLLTPNLTVIQQFYFRIIIGLAAAGMAVVIPGFCEIEIKWLRNTIRAGGAIGVFFLIYSFNPPIIEQFKPIHDITGRFKYHCTSLNGPFSHGGVQHGGIAHIQLIRTTYGYALSISGDRQWIRKEEKRLSVDPPSTWQTISCNLTGDDTLIYEYRTTEQGMSYHGVSTLKIIKDRSGAIIRLEGTFYRLPRSANDTNSYGNVVFERD